MKRPKQERARRKNATRACQYCRSHHVRCTAGPLDDSCHLCTERGLKCVFEVQKKRGPKPRSFDDVATKKSRKLRGIRSRSLSQGSMTEERLFTTRLNDAEFPLFLSIFTSSIFPFQPSIEHTSLRLVSTLVQSGIDVVQTPHLALLAYAALARGARALNNLLVAKELAVRAMSLARCASDEIEEIKRDRELSTPPESPTEFNPQYILAQGLLTLAFYLYTEGNFELAQHYNTQANQLCVASGHPDSLARFLCLTNTLVTSADSEQQQTLLLDRLSSHFLKPHISLADLTEGSASSSSTPTSALASITDLPVLSDDIAEPLRIVAYFCVQLSHIITQCDLRHPDMLKHPKLDNRLAPLTESEVEVYMTFLATLDDIDVNLHHPDTRAAFRRRLMGEAQTAVADRYCLPNHMVLPLLAVIYALRALIYHLLHPDSPNGLTLGAHAIDIALSPEIAVLPSFTCLPLMMTMPVLLFKNERAGLARFQVLKRMILKSGARYPILKERLRTCGYLSQKDVSQLFASGTGGVSPPVSVETPHHRRGPGHSSGELQSHIRLSDAGRSSGLATVPSGLDSADEIRIPLPVTEEPTKKARFHSEAPPTSPPTDAVDNSHHWAISSCLRNSPPAKTGGTTQSTPSRGGGAARAALDDLLEVISAT